MWHAGCRQTPTCRRDRRATALDDASRKALPAPLANSITSTRNRILSTRNSVISTASSILSTINSIISTRIISTLNPGAGTKVQDAAQSREPEKAGGTSPGYSEYSHGQPCWLLQIGEALLHVGQRRPDVLGEPRGVGHLEAKQQPAKIAYDCCACEHACACEWSWSAYQACVRVGCA